MELQHALPVPDFLGGQFRVFWDGGIVHDRQVLVGEETTASVTGIGGGITLELGRNYRFELELVAPTTARSASDNQNKLRVWAGLSAYF